MKAPEARYPDSPKRLGANALIYPTSFVPIFIWCQIKSLASAPTSDLTLPRLTIFFYFLSRNAPQPPPTNSTWRKKFNTFDWSARIWLTG